MPIDVDLLEACIKGKKKAQKELYEACFMFLMPICMRYHNNKNDARAIYNVAFLKILKNLEKLDIEKVPFIAWARRVMTNTLIDEYRKEKKYKENISKREDERELEYHSSPVFNNINSQFEVQSIMNLLNQLKPATKQVFILYAIEGYTHKEIGEILDMSTGTSKWHLSIARKELQEFIIKQNKLDFRHEAI